MADTPLTNVQQLELKRKQKEQELQDENKSFTYDTLARLSGIQPDLIKVIHRAVAKGTTNAELAYFLTYCKAIGLNPLNKEIWCYKDSQGNVIIFTGRDGFLKKNKENVLFRGMKSSDVCEYDEFNIDMISGEVRHSITNNRGPVIGAYAIVYIEGQKDVIVYLDFAEFNLGQAKWKTAPKMMIKKCAQSHALKEAAGLTGIQAEEAFIIKNDVAYTKEIENVTAINHEEDRLMQLIESAKTLEALKKLDKECITPEAIAAYDKRKKELEGVNQ